MEILTQLGLTLLGSLIILFLRAVAAAKASGDSFNFLTFLIENRQRLALVVFGVLVFGVTLYVDAAGLADLLRSLPVQIQITSPLILGAAIASLVLIVPRKTQS